jgi:Cu(I)/Ag(I) efflux system membrane fusion protein
MTKKKAAGIALLAIVIPATYLLANATTPTTDATPLLSITKQAQEKIFICPMHPEIMQDHPGTCPICGMDLVESKNHIGHDHGVRVDSATVQKLGVRLAHIKKSTISEEINSYGNVTVDEGTLHNIHSKYEGWIKKVHIHSVGQRVEKGDVIYELYSPDLIMRQKEYLRFMARRNQILQTIGDVRLQENEYVMELLMELSRERTKFLHEDISIETVRQIEDDKQPLEVVKIVAAKSGVVTQINAREGSFIEPAATLFTLTDIGKVWVDITLYPDQAGQIKNGDEVTITTANGQSIDSRIDFVSPIAVNNKVNARASINNTKLKLRPGAFVDVTIHAQPHEALVLPRSAVLRGGDGDRVMLSRGDGHFLPAYIETGIENGDDIEIVDGLLEGAEVAANGQFLLDSAASMNAAAERMRSGMHSGIDNGE